MFKNKKRKEKRKAKTKFFTHPMVVWEDLTYPKVACLGAIVNSLRDVLVAIRRRPRREATVTDIKEDVGKGKREEGRGDFN